MADPNKVTVYCDSYLTSDTASDLAHAGFGTVILAVPAANDEMLRQNIFRLKSDGMVRNVLFSLRGDYRAILGNKVPFKSSLAAAMDYYGIDGVDLDPETASPRYFDLVVELTGWVAATARMVTASPSAEPAFWAEVLKATDATMGWWNLQLSNGADYLSWVCAVVESGAMPSEAAQSFVVPGYNVGWSAPATIALELQGLKEIAAWLDGAHLRRYEEMKGRACDWGKAIWSGLGTSPAEAERPWRALA